MVKKREKKGDRKSKIASLIDEVIADTEPTKQPEELVKDSVGAKETEVRPDLPDPVKPIEQ